MKISDPHQHRHLALPLAVLAVVMLQACGLTDDSEPADAAPPVVALPPAEPAAPAADTTDWEAEYQRLIEQIMAGEEPDLAQAEPADTGPVVVLPPEPATAAAPPSEPPVVVIEEEPPLVVVPPTAAPTIEPPPQVIEPVITPPVSTAPVTQPPARPFDDSDVAQLMAASRAHAAMTDERTARLVARYLDEGLTALDDGDLQGAQQYFGSALELDPTDPAARDLYDRTALLMGGDSATLGTVARSARDRAAASRDQQTYLVRHRIEQGTKALAQDDPTAALAHFEDAMTMLKASPDLAAGSPLETEVAGLIMEAKTAALDLDQRRDTQMLDRAMQRQEELDRAESTREKRSVAQLMRTANDAFMRNDYDAAEMALVEVLRIEKENPEALELWRVANRARHSEINRDARRTYVDQWRQTFDELEWDAVPQLDQMVFPDRDEWDRIAERGSKALQGDDATRADDDAVAARLAEVRIPVNFDNVQLDEVVTHLSQVTGVNIIMSQDVQDTTLEPYSLLDRARLPVDRILTILLEDLSNPPLSYTIKDGVVKVITADEAREDYVLQMYDIRDLTATPSDYASQDFNLLPSGTDPDSFRDGVEDEEPVPYIAEDSLVSLIEENIDPDTWSDDPERTIQLLPGTLVVRQTPDVHAKIVNLLDDLRANTKTLVHIETRFLEVEDSFLEDVGVDFRGLDDQVLEDFGQSGVGFGTPEQPLGIGTGNSAGFFYSGKYGDMKGRTENLFDFMLGEKGTLNNAGGLSMQALFLGDVDVSAVLRAVSKSENTNIVNAPSLTLRSGQRGSIQVLTKRTYVWDFEPEIAQGSVIAQPELQNVNEGVVLDVRAVASSDRRFITLEMRPTLATLIPDRNGDVLPDVTVSLATGNSSDVTIELPQLNMQRVRTTATIPDGATLLLGGLKKSVEQDYESGMPFLSDVPFLSFFFTRKGQYTSRRKVIILMKATLIIPEEQEPVVGMAR